RAPDVGAGRQLRRDGVGRPLDLVVLRHFPVALGVRVLDLRLHRRVGGGAAGNHGGRVRTAVTVAAAIELAREALVVRPRLPGGDLLVHRAVARGLHVGVAVMRPDVERRGRVTLVQPADRVVHRARERERGARADLTLVVGGAFGAVFSVVHGTGERAGHGGIELEAAAEHQLALALARRLRDRHRLVLVAVDVDPVTGRALPGTALGVRLDLEPQGLEVQVDDEVRRGR